MTNQVKLTTFVFAALLTLSLQAGQVSAFDSPVPTPERTPAPPPPRPTPPVETWTSKTRPGEPSESSLTVVSFGWTTPAWDPLDVSYQTGPGD